MGACCGPVDEQDVAVDKELKHDRVADNQIHKLLLLGAGGSGKSTFFKQLVTIHGAGHTDRDRESYKRQIYGQVVESVQTLVRQCRLIAEPAEEEEESDAFRSLSEEEKKELIIEDEMEESARYMEEVADGYTKMDWEVAKHIRELWTKSNAIKKMFEQRNKLAVPDSTAYFLEQLNALEETDYLPDDHDILMVRYRTTGMAEKEFTINNHTIKIVDVGGQRNERRKWMNFFDGVTAVIFVVSLTCYDEVPFEDAGDLDTTDLAECNNMKESLTIFSEQLNSEVFGDKGFILFLNKKDVMKDKIKRVNITTAFPKYRGEQEYKPAVEFIRKQFLKLNTTETREIYSHVTCAMDNKNVERVFDDVQNCVVNMSLAAAGLIV